MFCKKGDFLYLEEGPVFEVVYADEEKAVCLVILRKGGRYIYERSCVISNKSEDYKGKCWINKGDRPAITEKRNWTPIKGVHRYRENKYLFN